MVTWEDIKEKIKWQWFLKIRPLNTKILLLIAGVYNKFKRE